MSDDSLGGGGSGGLKHDTLNESQKSSNGDLNETRTFTESFLGIIGIGEQRKEKTSETA